MNREFIRENHQYLTGKASDIVRQLALAAIAVVWIFKTTDGLGVLRLPDPLRKAAFISILSLALDLLQYFVGSAIWGCYGVLKDRVGGDINAEFVAPASINWPANFFFWSKAVLILFAYGLLLGFLWKAIGST